MNSVGEWARVIAEELKYIIRRGDNWLNFLLIVCVDERMRKNNVNFFENISGK